MTETTPTGAIFSDCRFYRYRLWRVWDADKPLLNMLMLNPSTADEITNDPTVERCERRARMWEFGGLVVTNIFAFRATDPRQMKAQPDPIGPENDQHLAEVAAGAGLVVCAWGQHGKHRARGWEVRRMLARLGVKLHALRITKSGEPEHPLYLKYDLKPVEWKYPQ